MKFTTAITLCLSAALQVSAFTVSGWLDSVIAHEGEPVGEEIDYNGRKTLSFSPQTNTTNRR